jgi:nucleoside-diphosphate-sugar epimerase
MIVRDRYMNQDVLVRMLADVLLVNLALIVAFAARILASLWLTSGGAVHGLGLLRQMLHSSAVTYLSVAPILTITCLAVFTWSGFYTYGRAYQGRWKALVIVQAVTLSYLILGASGYLLTKVAIWLPRTVWLTAFLLTLVLVAAARLCGRVWLLVARPDYTPGASSLRHRVHNVLVIGGAGYIGSILVRKLLDRGYHVTVLDALLYGDEGIRELYGRANFTLIKDDFRNIEGVVRALQGRDAVFHLGAVVGDPACALDERLTLEINLAATRLIGEAAHGFGIERFIFASTCSVYGASEQISDERSSLNPVSLYARSKISAERALLDLEDGHFAPTILRFATIFGLSPRPRFDLVVNILAARAARDKRITIFGGDQWRPFVHVDDVATALLKCLEAPVSTVKGQIFNVGGDDQNYRIKDVGTQVAELIPDTEIVQRGEDTDPRNYRVSFAKIRKQLGFQPVHSVTNGIAEIRDAVVDGRLGNFDDPRYSNLACLSDPASLALARQSRMSPLYGGTIAEPAAPMAPSLAAH